MGPLVDFVHRDKRPEQPVEGTFYWIESEDKTEIWFSPDSEYDHMVLLNDDRVDELVSAVSSIRTTLNNIRTEILREVDSRQYLTQDSLEGYAKLTDIPDPRDLTPMDYEYLADLVNEKTVPPLKWIEVN